MQVKWMLSIFVYFRELMILIRCQCTKFLFCVVLPIYFALKIVHTFLCENEILLENISKRSLNLSEFKKKN